MRNGKGSDAVTVIPIRATTGITIEDLMRWERDGRQPGPGPRGGWLEGLHGWRAWTFCVVAVAVGVGIVLAIVLPLASWLARMVP